MIAIFLEIAFTSSNDPLLYKYVTFQREFLAPLCVNFLLPAKNVSKACVLLLSEIKWLYNDQNK